jgi:hypothetical protein
MGMMVAVDNAENGGSSSSHPLPFWSVAKA